MATLRQKRVDYLQNNGLLGFEARALAKNYTQGQIRQLPYISRLLRSRRLYIANQRNRGLTNPQIDKAIRAMYRRYEWLDKDGKLDVWHLLRRLRQAAIDLGKINKDAPGAYFPPKRSHHSVREQITAEQLGQQRRKLAGKRRELQDRIDDLNLLASRARTEKEKQTFIARRDYLQRQMDGLR